MRPCLPLLVSVIACAWSAALGCAWGADAAALKPVPVITVTPHTVSWGHSVAFDDHGLPTPDAWFDVEFALHADHDTILACPHLEITTAVTDSGEALSLLPPLLDWSQGAEDPSDSGSCHATFKPPQKTARTLTISGRILVAPPGALRFVDLFPLGTYLGAWAAVQGLPGGALHAYRQDDAIWLQFSPALTAVFHSMHYVDADGTELDIPDWTTSDDALPAYSNGVNLSDSGRLTVGYLDLAKAVIVPFSFTALALDGSALDRTPPPPHCVLTVPSRDAAAPAPELPAKGVGEKF